MGCEFFLGWRIFLVEKVIRVGEKGIELVKKSDCKIIFKKNLCHRFKNLKFLINVIEIDILKFN